MLTIDQWREKCIADGELKIASKGFSGSIRFRMESDKYELGFDNGVITDAVTEPVLEYSASRKVWQQLTAAIPARFNNDLMANISQGQGVSRSGDQVLQAQYYGAVARALELMRPDIVLPAVESTAETERLDDIVGRYVHLDLAGVRHRIYFEEAGQGIPVLLQHTAGCHGSQWRHLMACTAITDHFRLIAYDLPFHGKSLPPNGIAWWAENYELKGEFLRALPLAMAQVLDLDRPVFMGCSVGGLLALDLAHKHPDAFRSVISVEGALNIPGAIEALGDLYHPKISNGYKARLMEGLMSPNSPLAYRKETSFVYASGWPPVFLGDLYYYLADYDLRDLAHEIDTTQVGVHILSGEYDYSGTMELGRQAHEAIAGSGYTQMKGVGHFPMSENPEAFINYLLPVLAQIRNVPV